MTEPRPPAPRQTTVRQSLADTLRREGLSAHDLSRRVGIPEKSVADHLAHLGKSLPAHGERLAVTPPQCLVCGYRFTTRSRLTRPSRCPQCRGTHLVDAQFRVLPL